MPEISIKKGLNLNLAGGPALDIEEAARPTRLGIMLDDFPGFKPRLQVKEGDTVQVGSILVSSKEDPRMCLVSPGSGTVAEIRLGARRRLEAISIELSGEEKYVAFPSHSREEVEALSAEKLTEILLECGLWPLLRQQPFNRIANPAQRPQAIFVGAMQADPFAPQTKLILHEKEKQLQLGLDLMQKLTDGKVYLCAAKRDQDLAAITLSQGAEKYFFSGPHPAGHIAVQIYHVAPPSGNQVVWHLDIQALLAIADLLQNGKLPTERLITLAGPGVRQPQHLNTRWGASAESLTLNRLNPEEMRLISGGVLTGRKIGEKDFLGFYDNSLCVFPEGRQREMLGFMNPGLNKYSSSRAFLSSLFPDMEYTVTTNRQGSLRSFVQTGIYEEVCAVDLYPAHLAKSVLADDFEEMEKHGILDCVQCGLCSYVCPSKIEVAAIIQSGIDKIEIEG